MAQKILVVDDDPIMHRVLQQYLEREGYAMTSARSGAEAIELANRERFHLIVLDVRMAEMDGLTVLSHLKESEATKAIPVIIATVNADHLTKTQSKATGAAAFLTKPFRPAQLLAEIKRLLPESRAGSDPAAN